MSFLSKHHQLRSIPNVTIVLPFQTVFVPHHSILHDFPSVPDFTIFRPLRLSSQFQTLLISSQTSRCSFCSKRRQLDSVVNFTILLPFLELPCSFRSEFTRTTCPFAIFFPCFPKFTNFIVSQTSRMSFRFKLHHFAFEEHGLGQVRRDCVFAELREELLLKRIMRLVRSNLLQQIVEEQPNGTKQQSDSFRALHIIKKRYTNIPCCLLAKLQTQ